MTAKPHRKIVHIDMDAFFASVEQRDFPELRGVPVVVGGRAERRGVVAAASYEARRYGIRSAMSMAEALRRCPHLRCQPVRREAYVEVSRQMMAIFERYTPLVEPLSIDEAFLDLTQASEREGLTATRLAAQLKDELREQTGLTASAGVAPNKFLAKVASDRRKPDGLTVVQPHQVLDFLEPLPVRTIWGIGPATEERLARLGIHAIGELRALSLEEALKHFGRAGWLYFRLARGLDDRPVQPRPPARSLSTERTFAHDLRDPEAIQEYLSSQAEELSLSCREQGLSGSTVVLKLRYNDFSTITRSQTLPQSTRCASLLTQVGHQLLERTDYRQRPVRLVGLGVTQLQPDDGPRQLMLFEWKEPLTEPH